MITSQLDLPALDPLSVFAANFFGAGRQPWIAKVADEILSCRPCLFSAPLVDPVIISGKLGSLPFVADVALASVERVLGLADSGLTMALLSPENAALIVELALENVLARIEAESGQSIQLSRIDDAGSSRPFPGYGFECTFGDLGPMRIAISGHAEIVNRLQSLAREQRLDYARVANLRQRVSFRTGFAALTIAELKALVPGDGIVLRRSHPEPNQVVAVVAERLLSICTVTHSGPSLIGRFLPARSRTFGDFLMNTEMPGQVAAAPKDEALRQLSDLPVRLVFELGHVDVPLLELANAGAGYVFVLPTALNQGCAIMSGGAVIGRGEVVKVGEQFAVRVVNLAAR